MGHGTALLASVQSPCSVPFCSSSHVCSPSPGTWTTCTRGATWTGTSLDSTRSSRTWRMSWRSTLRRRGVRTLTTLTSMLTTWRTWRISPLRRRKTAKPSLTTERAVLPDQLFMWKMDNRVVELDGNTTAKFESTKITNRCTVLYKPTNCTGPIKLTCSKFLVDNRDPMHCKKGDSFITKPAAKNNTVEQPHIWCKREGPSENFPSLSPYGNLKVWYKRSTGQLGTGRFPKKGVRCSVSC